MSCFDGGPPLILVGQKPRAMKHEPRNLNLETYNPPKHVKFQWVAQCTFQFPNSLSLETYPIKTCNVSRAMFWPHLPIFRVPLVIPIHDTLNIFQFSHTSFNFWWITILRQLMKVME